MKIKFDFDIVVLFLVLGPMINRIKIIILRLHCGHFYVPPTKNEFVKIVNSAILNLSVRFDFVPRL